MGTKISDLTELAAGGLASGDFFPVVDTDAGTTKKLDADNVLDALNVTAFVKTLLDDANATAILTTLGLDTDLLTLSLPASTTISAFIKTLLDDSTASAARSTLGTIGLDLFTGLVDRAQFTHSNDTDILIGAFRYHHVGTTTQILYSDAQLTFVIGPGGSNGDSSAIGTSQWMYIYLDDSAIVTAGTNVVTESEIVASTTAPTYSQTNHGWYNGDDRCIFAVYIDGSGDIVEFFHDGGVAVFYADMVADLAHTDIDTTWTDVTLTIPGFSTRADVSSEQVYTATDDTFYWRTNGQTGTTGHNVTGSAQAGQSGGTNTFPVITDSSQIIEVKCSASNASTVALWTENWYLPIGM